MKKKKVAYILNMLLTVAIFVISMGILAGAVSARIKDKTPSIFGYTLHIVVTGSMEPQIKAGDFVLAKKCAVEEVEQGDYIVFRSANPSLKGMIIIHEAILITESGGEIIITTKGTNNDDKDSYPVKSDNLISVYRWKSTFLGKIVAFFSDLRNIGILLIIGVILFFSVKSITKAVKDIRENSGKESGNEENVESVPEETAETEKPAGEAIESGITGAAVPPAKASAENIIKE